MKDSGDYISREAAKDAALEKIINNVVEDQGMYGYLCYLVDDVFDELPAADVRPVVLCRDCKHRDPEDHKCDSGEVERQGCPFEVADDYFCAYGEKREESLCMTNL